jgi:tryptophan halogenase
MGFRPEPGRRARRSAELDAAEAYFREAAALTRKMLGALPTNRALIEHIVLKGLPTI